MFSGLAGVRCDVLGDVLEEWQLLLSWVASEDPGDGVGGGGMRKGRGGSYSLSF